MSTPYSPLDTPRYLTADKPDKQDPTSRVIVINSDKPDMQRSDQRPDKLTSDKPDMQDLTSRLTVLSSDKPDMQDLTSRHLDLVGCQEHQRHPPAFLMHRLAFRQHHLSWGRPRSE